MSNKVEDEVAAQRGRWMNSRQAAEHIGYELGTLHNLTAKGEIPFEKVRGRLRFRVTQLDEWMEQQKVPA